MSQEQLTLTYKDGQWTDQHGRKVVNPEVIPASKEFLSTLEILTVFKPWPGTYEKIPVIVGDKYVRDEIKLIRSDYFCEKCDKPISKKRAYNSGWCDECQSLDKKKKSGVPTPTGSENSAHGKVLSDEDQIETLHRAITGQKMQPLQSEVSGSVPEKSDNELKLYGIWSGCIHEGGGVEHQLYRTKESAREKALQMVAEKQKEQDEIYADVPKDEQWSNHPWAEKTPDFWHNEIDGISIQEFTIVQ